MAVASLYRHPSSAAGIDPVSVASAAASLRGFAWLDSGPGGRSILTWNPGPRLEMGPGWKRRARALLKSEAADPDLPFSGGLLGVLPYESRSRLLSGAGLARYPGGLCYDPDAGAWRAAGEEEFVEEARALLEAVEELDRLQAPTGRLESVGSPGAFLAGVEEVLGQIQRGELYQVNLSRQICVSEVGDPFQAYLRLRGQHPAEFGAYLALPRATLISNSPELYLDVDPRGGVRTRPIKGTRPRGSCPASDCALREELERDPKERAELTMIVDMARNDLGRVCRPGSISVSSRQIQDHPTLFHADREVQGVLATGQDSLDLVEASFPPASVTGAPKVAAMQSIARLEAHARGCYTGAVGFFADGGSATLSVAIRCATIVENHAWIHVGSGIVADSDPQRELEESRWKALGLLGALLAPHPDRMAPHPGERT